MKKRFLAFLLAIVMLLTACSPQTDYPKMEMRFRISGSPAPSYVKFEASEWHFSHYTPISNEWREFIDSIYLAQVDFLNENYDANWTYIPAEVYFVDFSESTLGFAIGGVFDPNTHCIYLSEDLLAQNPYEISSKNLSEIVHEGYHYLQFSNTGRLIFGLVKNSAELGRIFSESIINFCTMKFLNSIGNESGAVCCLQNGYASGTVLCQLLELACPDLMNSFVLGDLATLQSEFNALCKQHIQNTRDDEFIYFLQSYDLLYEQEKEFKKGSPESFIMVLYYLLQNVEVLAAITESTYEETFRNFLLTYDLHYMGEIFVGESYAFIDYFSSLHYTEPEIETEPAYTAD